MSHHTRNAPFRDALCAPLARNGGKLSCMTEVSPWTL